MFRSKAQRLLLPAVLASMTLGGCASMQDGSTESAMIAQKEAEIARLSSQVNQMKQSLTAEQRARMAAEASMATTPVSTDMDLLPPNAKSGECYARAFAPPVYKTENIRVLRSDASESITVIPEKYEWATEKVLVREASERLEVIPAVYETVSEKLMVKPAGKKIVTVPAKYRTDTERMLDKPEHTIWQKGTGPITRIDDATGEIMCLVTVPATYRTVSKQVLVTPATTQEVAVPAQYETVTRRVMKTPPTTRKITIPAEYKTVRVRQLAEPAKTVRTPIPASYGTVQKRELVKEGRMEWRPVLCRTNITPEIVRRIQTALKNAGHNPGPIDGVIGRETMAAVRSYQQSKRLATGGLTIKTLESLGVKI
ncbi:MAG: peptidoglycan-binding protein [Gammaproteobacteria bacterium]